ncbi:hypothetical protein [Arthrobacter sp. JSM 101049]|uniref:hypothetical protein n=1 Tax=Arthrobacter sp. JSM 101049 TaxID=929097 RepID=UPI003563A694
MTTIRIQVSARAVDFTAETNIPETLVTKSEDIRPGLIATANKVLRAYQLPEIDNTPPTETTPGTLALADVAAERTRQNEKWGEQNHPDGTGPREFPLAAMGGESVFDAQELAAQATRTTDHRAANRMLTWKDILLEEVFEALAESDPVSLRTELIQVAAVAAQWAEAIDRRNNQGDAA